MKIFTRIFLALVLIFGSSGAFALSDEVRFDMLRTKLVEQLKGHHYKDALKTIAEIRQMKQSLPASIDYFEGKSLFESGNPYEAYLKLEQYVDAQGKEGKYYRQALAYLVKAEDAYQAEQKKRELQRKEQIEKARKQEQLDKKLRAQARKFSKKLTRKDSETGLIWTRVPAIPYRNNPYLPIPVKASAKQAKDFCEQLDLDGITNWELPNMRIFSSIAGDWGKNNTQLWMRGNREFSEKGNHDYKDGVIYAIDNESMTREDKRPSTAMVICVAVQSLEKLKAYFAREYRIIQFKGHKIMMEDRYMVDSDTNYYRDPRVHFASAKRYCENLNLGGFDDWHVPTEEDILKRLPCKIPEQLSFMRDDFFYNRIWFYKPGFLSRKTGFQDPENCKIKYNRHDSDRYSVRCVRDLEKPEKATAENSDDPFEF